MKTLKRADFKRIYDIAYEEWKQKLLSWYGDKFSISDEIEVKDSEYKLMRGACTKEQHELFDKIFCREVSIIDRIGSLEEAIKELGEKDEEVKELRKLQKSECKTSFQELVIIAKALNEGWYPDFNNTDQRKYFVYINMQGEPSYGYWLYDDYGSNVPARLLLKNDKLAEYFGKQFINIWREYMK